MAGIGDRHAPEQPIVFAGMRTQEQGASATTTFSTVAGGQQASETITSIPAGCLVSGLDAAPTGQWVAAELSCANSHATLVHVTNSQSGLAKTVGSELGPQSIFLDWSPNGQHIILLRNVLSDPEAVLVRLEDNTVTALNTAPDVYNVAVSHNGLRMVYSVTRGLGYGSQTWLADIDGQNPQLVIYDPNHIVAFARFSPDDTKIVFVRMQDSNIPFTVGELWVMNADGSGQKLLGLADAGHGYEPAWSPDGTRIAFVYRENGYDITANQLSHRLVSNLHIADLTTGTVAAVTAFKETLVESPVWSPDGIKLAFSATPRNGVADIWVLAPDLVDAAQVTQNANARHPTWISGR